MQAFARGLDGLTGARSDRSWIDDAVPAEERVAFLFGGAADPFAESKILWETEFWNRRLSSVYYLGQSARRRQGFPTSRPPPIRPPGVSSLPARRRLAIVVAPSTLELVGRRVAATPALVLYELRPPARLAETVDGIYPDSWMGSDAALTRYAPQGKRIRVTLSRTAWGGPDTPSAVRVDVRRVTGEANGSLTLGKPTALRTWTIHSASQKTFTLPAPKPPYRVELHMEPTFSPAQFGQPDTRQLGAQVFFGR